MNEVLQELYLADNKLMPSDGIQLGNMLKFNHSLQLLDVRNNHLQVRGYFCVTYLNILNNWRMTCLNFVVYRMLEPVMFVMVYGNKILIVA